MTVTPSYQVLSITNSNLDISQKVVSISPATDDGSGSAPMMIIKLDAKNGQFITQSNGGTTPIISQFTVFKVTFTDQDNVSYIKGYLVDTLKQIQNQQEGDRLELTCYGMEYWEQRLDFAKQFYFADAWSTFASICDIYNVNKGSSQPLLVNYRNSTFNRLPKWTANNYLFNASELACYTGKMEVVDKTGASVQNGGSADFFEYKLMNGDVSAAGYPNTGIDFNKITPIVFSSGSSPGVQVDERPPGTPLIITPSNSIRITEITGEVEAIQGTLIKAWGDDQSGSWPLDFSKFRGLDEAYYLFPAWQNPASTGQPYPAGALATFDPGTGQVLYKSLIDNNTSVPNVANWSVYSESSFLTDNNSTGYNPLATTGNGSALMSCMADPTSLAYGVSAWDGNLVIQDGDYYRTWGDIREISDTLVPGAYKEKDRNGVPQFFRGFRILVDLTLGTKGGLFAQNSGKDRFGNSYDDALVINNGNGTGTYQDWDCVWTKTNPPKASAFLLKTNYQCAIIAEAKNYKWNGSNWADNSATSKGNDCFHPRGNMTTAQGTSQVPKNSGGTYGDNSAIQITYSWSPLAAVAGIVFTDGNYYKAGWWLNLRFPFPSTSLVGTIPVGSIFGGYQNVNQNTFALEPATLDTINMHLTPSGNVGFNQTDSEALGSLYGLAIQMKMRLQDDAGNMLFGLTGTFANFKMRAYLFDTNDNVVYQDFTLAFNDVWQDCVLPIQNFQIYRGRIPLTFGDINAITPIPQLNILNVFYWRNIKQIVIQCQNVYEEQGRYAPELSDLNTFALLTTQLGRNAQMVGTVDSIRFIKPLLATNGPVSGYVIEPETLQHKNITNYFQLKQDVLSYADIYKFQRKEFEVTMNLNCKVRFGDTFYLRDPNVVETQSPPDTAPDGIGTNTIKLVAKPVTYYLNKTDDGPGGLITVLKGIKRYPLS